MNFVLPIYMWPIFRLLIHAGEHLLHHLLDHHQLQQAVHEEGEEGVGWEVGWCGGVHFASQFFLASGRSGISQFAMERVQSLREIA